MRTGVSTLRDYLQEAEESYGAYGYGVSYYRPYDRRNKEALR
jgi:hypothetical protein